MPNNLTDDPTTFPSPIQVPAAGDPRTDTSVATPFQQVANRTANTKARVDAVVPFSQPGYSPALPSGVTSGVSTMLTATSIAALQTIPAANRVDGMLCYVYSDAVYQFNATSSLGGNPLYIVQPNDVPGASPGRWLRVGFNGLNVAYGLPEFDSGARLAAAAAHYGTVIDAFATVASTTPSLTTTGSTPIAGASVSLPGVANGDLIRIEFACTVTNIPATGGVATNGVIVNVALIPPGGSVGTGIGAVWQSNSQGASLQYSAFAMGSEIVTTAGTWTAIAQANATAAATGSIVFQGGELRARVVRP